MKQNTAIICLSPYSGGMEIDSIKLAKKLSLYSRITIIAKEKHFIADSSKEYEGYNNIELEKINFSSSFSLSIIFKVREIIKRKNIKNVIFFGASEMKSLYFAFLGLDINLIIRHGTTKSRPKKDWFHRLIYSNVNYHVSICKHLQKNVEYIIPFGKKTKSKLIYSSLEIEQKEKIEHNKLSLVHIGRIAEGKGQIDAIKACKVLYEEGIDFKFYILGGFDEIYKNEFINFYDRLEYKHKIELVGFTKDINSYLSRSDIFLFPSYGEGLSNAFLEALSAGLICISYDNTSFPELKDLGLKFHMVKDRDIKDLKKKLLAISKNILAETSYVNQNKALVQKLFSLKREVKDYLGILR